MRILDHWIDGKSRPPASGRYLTTRDPRTGEPVAEVALGAAAEVAEAVGRARAAHGDWAALSAGQRGRVLLRLGGLIRDHGTEIAEQEISETGKMPGAMRGEVETAADLFEYYGGIIRAFGGEEFDLGAGRHAYTRHEPFPVTGIITPWNFPLTQASRDIAPVLAVGGAVVVKPSEFTSSSTVLLARLAEEAGLPPGVLNVVLGTGAEAGAEVARHPGVARMMFTGSVAAGRTVAQTAVGRGVPVTLELGGKSPTVVFADADLPAAARGIAGFTHHCGQVCSALSRLIVEQSVHDELVTLVREIVAGLEPGAGLGPLTTPAQFDKVRSYFSVAEAEGAELVIGGRAADGGDLAAGRYVYPTIYQGVTPRMRIFREEIFGPVLTVTAFTAEDEAVRLANDTEYGLNAALWTADSRRAHRVAAQIEAGQIWINGAGNSVEMPFGGYKGSGFGRAKGFEALRDCTQVKSIVLPTA